MRANNGTLRSLLSMGKTSINQTATRFEVAPNVAINLALVSSQRARSSASFANREYTAGVVCFGNEGWSLYGARGLQPVASRGKCRRPEQGRNRSRATSSRLQLLVAEFGFQAPSRTEGEGRPRATRKPTAHLPGSSRVPPFATMRSRKAGPIQTFGHHAERVAALDCRQTQARERALLHAKPAWTQASHAGGHWRGVSRGVELEERFAKHVPFPPRSARAASHAPAPRRRCAAAPRSHRRRWPEQRLHIV